MSKDTLRPTEMAEESVESIKQSVSSAIPWLPSHTCEACGALCEETEVFDPTTAAFEDRATPAWFCPNCETHYYRDDGSNLTFDPFR